MNKFEVNDYVEYNDGKLYIIISVLPEEIYTAREYGVHNEDWIFLIENKIECKIS